MTEINNQSQRERNAEQRAMNIEQAETNAEQLVTNVEIKKDVEHVLVKIDRLDGDMGKVKKALWGINGDEEGMGLISKVSMIAAKMSTIEKIALGILGAVIAVGVGIAYQLIVLHPLP